MKYEIGMKLQFVPVDKGLKIEEVTVTGLRKGCCAKLSNGWLADSSGVCEGNATHKGARVCLPEEEPKPVPEKRGKYKHHPTMRRAINE